MTVEKFKLTESLMKQAMSYEAPIPDSLVSTATTNFGAHFQEFKYGPFHVGSQYLMANYNSHDGTMAEVGDIRISF